MKSLKLMIPGPVDVADDVREAMGVPTVPHYGDEWVAMHRETLELLKQVHRTQNDLFLIVGTGTAGLDAGLGSLLYAGEKVLVPINGFFGERMAAVARGCGLEVVRLEFPLERPVDPQAIRERLVAEKDIRLVALVHHETSTGLLNPLQEVAAAARGQGVPVLVDAIASLGGVPLPVDEWGLDFVVAVGNKCLEAPPGLATVCLSQRAWEMIESRPNRGRGWYLNLETWREYAETWGGWHPSPVTMPGQNLLALFTSLRRIVARGWEEHFQRFVRAAERVRAGMSRMGFELYLKEEHTCPIISVFKALPGFTSIELVRFLEREHQVKIAWGLGPTREQLLRVGHMGLATTDEYVEAFLTGVEDFLRN